MAKRKIEVFTAGCGICEPVVELVKRIACPSCDVHVLDLSSNPEELARAREYGVQRVPAVVVDGRLVSCCAVSGPDETALRAAGIGQPL